MVVVRTIDRKIARLDRSIIEDEVRRLDAGKPRFKSSHKDGIETIWMEGVRGPRMIHGIAATNKPTHLGTDKAQVLLCRGCMARLPIPLMSRHGAHGGAIGEVFYFRKTADQIYVRALLNKTEAADYAWQLIESLEVKCFSTGPSQAADKTHIQAMVDGIKFYDLWWLEEVSICRAGANPEACFEVLHEGF